MEVFYCCIRHLEATEMDFLEHQLTIVRVTGALAVMTAFPDIAYQTFLYDNLVADRPTVFRVTFVGPYTYHAFSFGPYDEE